MKLTAFILLIACVQVSAKGHAQKISLSLKNAPLQQAFKAIEQQSGYTFVYNEDHLFKSKSVTVTLKDVSLETALLYCFREQPFTYAIVNRLIVVKETGKVIAEQPKVNQNTPPIDVKGRVLNERGQPVEGVTVTIKGSDKRTVTNTNGEFSLETVDHDAVLIFTHISMETFEVRVSGKTELAINLKTKISALGDVTVTVNTGYQQIPKERSTGSFTQIDNRLYNEQVGTNILDRLKHISNGIIAFPQRIGGGSNQILIRGISTLTSEIQKPLIILDNFEYQGDINNINPNDVDNVTFLKDAAAGSIWGAKAANGVIVITTKKGKYNNRTKVEFSSNVTIGQKPDLFYLKSISSSELIDVELYLFDRHYRFSDTSLFTRPPFSSVYEILFKRKNGLISAPDSALQIDALRQSDVRNDFDKYLYQNGINQQYSISLKGGSNNIAWVFSGGVDKNLSELNDKYNRITARIGNTYKVTKQLEIGTEVYYTQSLLKAGRPAYGSINTSVGSIPIYTKLADGTGTALPLYIKYRAGYIDTLGAGKLFDWRYYPLEDYKYVNNKTNLQDLNAVININYKLMKSLSIDIKLRYEVQKSENKIIYDQQSYYARDLVNSFSQLNTTTGAILYKIPKGDIIDLFYRTIKAHNIRGQVNYNNNWEKHSLNGIVGSEINETRNESNLYRTYGYNGETLTYGNVDFANPYPQFVFGSSFIPNPTSFAKTNTRFVSFYANGAYSYDKKYTISASARRDATNMFGVDINDKWRPLWSLGFNWDISNEDFYKAALIPYLRIRLTYGQQGNVDPSKVAVTTFRYMGTNQYTQAPYSQVRNFVNPDLKWEQVGMFNVGIDFASKGNRITGSLEFYKKNVTDLYGPVEIDRTTGLGTNTIIKNVGLLRGHGFDLELNTVNVNSTIKWFTNFIFNTYRDKVNQYYDPEKLQARQIVTFGGKIEGYPSYALFAYKWAGLDPATGDPQVYLGGSVSKDWNSLAGSGGSLQDIKYIGPRIPTIFGSVGNTISYKNISINFRITYKFGHYFLRESIRYSALMGSLSGHSDYTLRWKKPGDESFTNVPSFTYPSNSSRDDAYNRSEILSTKADNIRLQYINVSYDLEKGKLRQLPFQNLRFFTTINDIGIIWKANKNGIDPDYSSLPPSKNISIGLNLSF